MTFKPGTPRPANSGRRPGSPNRITKVMRDEWLAAYEAEGGVEYLRRVAREEPGIFVRGLIRMIPNAVEAKLDAGVRLKIVDRSDAAPVERDDDGQLPEPREPAADERPLELRDAPRDLAPASMPAPEPVFLLRRAALDDYQDSADFD